MSLKHQVRGKAHCFKSCCDRRDYTGPVLIIFRMQKHHGIVLSATFNVTLAGTVAVLPLMVAARRSNTFCEWWRQEGVWLQLIYFYRWRIPVTKLWRLVSTWSTISWFQATLLFWLAAVTIDYSSFKTPKASYAKFMGCAEDPTSPSTSRQSRV
jgi:hypothetical protein